MRRLIIAALPASILLCVFSSNPQGRRLPPIGRTPLKINLLRGGAPPAHAPASERGAAPGAQESISLEPGKAIERELSGGQSHFYRVGMAAGQYLQVVVNQQGIDALVALFTPDGKKISEVDSNPVIEGSETVLTIAEVAGAYLIEVRSSK
jgi:hypothetical protein